MNDESVIHGIRAAFDRHRRRRRLLTMAIVTSVATLRGVVSSAPANADTGPLDCGAVYDPSATYPTLSEVSTGPDVSGEAGLTIYLHEDRAVVEIGDCFRAVDRPLEVDFGELDLLTLLIELPDHPVGASVRVSEDDEWLETVNSPGNTLSYVMLPDHSLGFEIAPPQTAAPTGPIVVAKPTTGNPKPK